MYYPAVSNAKPYIKLCSGNGVVAILDSCELVSFNQLDFSRFSIDDSELIDEKTTCAICGGSFHIFIELMWIAGVCSSMC